MDDTIKLNVINKTADIDAAHLVICQHNAGSGMRSNPVAWRVLRNIARQESQQFELPQHLEVGAQDTLGNVTPRLAVEMPQTFDLIRELAGIALQPAKDASSRSAGIEVRNTWEQGEAEASVYKAGRLLATKTDIAPGAAAVFLFQPHIYIGLAGQITEGEVLSDAVASRITTRINLFGVASADIVMTSSNHGPHQPQFQLQNIQ